MKPAAALGLVVVGSVDRSGATPSRGDGVSRVDDDGDLDADDDIDAAVVQSTAESLLRMQIVTGVALTVSRNRVVTALRGTR
jgi:hypothetical protein